VARLIDADAFMKEYCKTNECLQNHGCDCRFCFVKSVLDEAPTVDAVEVVRCIDCAIPHNRWTGCPKLGGLVTPPDFFCAFGTKEWNYAD
jgi:hypothetical protein